MKKFKAISTSALAFLMCGSVFLAGCGDDKKGDGTIPDGPATTEVKAEVFGDAIASFESILKDGKTYKVTIDADMSGGMTYEQYGEMNIGGNVSGLAYFQYTPGDNPVINLDATADVTLTKDDSVEDWGEVAPYMYAAAHIRTDDVYATYTMSETEITQEVKDALPFMQMAMEDIMSMMGGSEVMPMAAMDEEDVTVASMMTEKAQALIEKMALGIVSGAEAEVKTVNGVTTLTYDIKAELTYFVNTMKGVLNSLTAETTVNSLLQNATVKAFYNKYFGAITAAELYDVLMEYEDMLKDEMGEEFTLPAPTEGQGSYDYIVSIVTTFAGEEMLNTTLGDMMDKDAEDLNGMKEMYTAQFDTALAMYKELKVSLSVKDGVFCGLGMVIDVDNEEAKIALTFDMTLEAVSYTFIDVTTLTVAG